MSKVLQLIASAAADFGAQTEEQSGSMGIFTLPLKLSDGSVLTYRLEVNVTDRGVTVREVTPHHLPSFCPPRHINPNGTFCLYWSEHGSYEVNSAEDATNWWAMLWKYLTLQARAEKKRRWPNNEEWAHGDAALHQQKAMAAAARLGPLFSSALDDLAIVVRRQPKRRTSQGPTLQVLVHGRHVYSVWLNSGKVVNRKQRCFCGSSGLKKPCRLRSCQGHAEDAAELALKLKSWQEAEIAFWDTFKDKNCCGTCDNCPLTKKQLWETQ